MISKTKQGNIGIVRPREIQYLYIENAEDYKYIIQDFLSYYFNEEVEFELVEDGDYIFSTKYNEIYIENKELYIVVDELPELRFEICTPEDFDMFYLRYDYITDNDNIY